jgi:hypothetical protein
VGDSVVGWVAQTKRSVLMDGRALPPELADRLAQPELRSSIIVPVEPSNTSTSSTPVAVLSVSSTQVTLDDEALEWLRNYMHRSVPKATRQDDSTGNGRPQPFTASRANHGNARVAR